MTIIERATYSVQDVEIEAREPRYQGFIQVETVRLRHRLFETGGYGPELNRELIQRKAAAGVLLYNDTLRRFALIEQFRVGAMFDPVSPWQLEVIAGVLDADESPESCIRREAKEESGCEIDQVQHLFSFYPSAGACSEIFHLYVAQTNLPETGGVFGLAEEGENIQLHVFDYDQLDLLFDHHRLKNAPVIMAAQWLKQHIQSVSAGELRP